MRYEMVDALRGENIVFVYGSNKAGKHGAGAALFATMHFGAKQGHTGLIGNSYGLSTKDESLKPLPLEKIETKITFLISLAKAQPDKLFILTPVGCGLAGYKRRDIWKMLQDNGPLPLNLVLSSSWAEKEGS